MFGCACSVLPAVNGCDWATHQRGAGVTGEGGRLRPDCRKRDASAAARTADWGGALPALSADAQPEDRTLLVGCRARTVPLLIMSPPLSVACSRCGSSTPAPGAASGLR